MGDMEVTKSMSLKKPVFKKDNDKPIAVLIRKRKSKKRADGKRDYSDYSELLRDIDRTRPVDGTTLLTKDVASSLKDKILRGITDEQACELAGVNYGTYTQWLVRYPLFKEFINKVKAQVEYDTLAYIHEAMGGGTWQAASWFLERKYPHKYGKRDVLKQQIYHVHIEFVRVVLDIVNRQDPEIKAAILHELKKKKIDIGG
jgi:hypothetical protein